MKPTREQALQWAREVDHWGNLRGEDEITALVLRAYAEGQRDMRERAETEVGCYLELQLANRIRALEIDE